MSDNGTASARRDAIEGLPPLRDVIAQHGLHAQKALGQNFLLDMNITDKIVRLAQDRDPLSWCGVHAIEIGAGPGGLTRALLKSDVADLTAYEYDRRAIKALQGVVDAAQGEFQLLHVDALKADILSDVIAPRVIIANLPYNIATPLLIGWLRHIRHDPNAIQSMALMFQKEVADRICAVPSTKAYGRLAVIAQWLCDVTNLYVLPPSAFTPPPKVTSAVVSFVPRILDPDAPDFKTVERVTAAAFNQRRKMIRSSMKVCLPAIEACGIDPKKRADELSVQDYLNIAKHVQTLGLNKVL